MSFLFLRKSLNKVFLIPDLADTDSDDPSFAVIDLKLQDFKLKIFNKVMFGNYLIIF